MIPAKNQTSIISASILRLRWLAIAAFCAFSLVFAVALGTGCGPSERQRVQMASDQFLDAMSQEDWDRAKPLLTEKARDAMGSLNPFPRDSEPNGKRHASISPNIHNYTLGEPSIEDDTAVLPVTLTSTEDTRLGTLRLRREDGEWRVGALRIEGENNAPGITLDFENPEAALLEATFRAVGEGVGEILKGVEKGMGAFMEGVEKGVSSLPVPEPDASGSPEEAESPGSDGEVRIEEQAGGSWS